MAGFSSPFMAATWFSCGTSVGKNCTVSAGSRIQAVSSRAYVSVKDRALLEAFRFVVVIDAKFFKQNLILIGRDSAR